MPEKDRPTMRRALALFSTDVGLPRSSSDRMLQRMMMEPGKLASLRRELVESMQSSDTPWRDLLSNDRYEIDDPDDEDEAKRGVLELLWDSAFPEQPSPFVEAESYRLFEVTEASNVTLMVDDTRSGKAIARIARLHRAGDVLEVDYTPLSDYPLPATCRKILWQACRRFLDGNETLSGVKRVSFLDLGGTAPTRVELAVEHE